jgi:phospholipase C
MAKWMTADGFSYQNGSVFDALAAKGLRWRLYMDEQGPAAGSFAQVASIERIMQSRDVYDVAQLAEDLKWPYGPRYTFIEPNYGDAAGDFSGGSSQHPQDGMYRGEQLIKQVYEAIRNSPAWMSSMLIITYDEHGGFYDSVKPGTAEKPGDYVLGDGLLNEFGFQFDRYGARVPAVVISPWIDQGKVDSTTYDHSSIPRTLEVLFGIKSLTQRDAKAKDLKHLISLSSPRTNCVPALSLGPVDTPAPTLTAEQQAQRDAEPLPTSGNEIGFLHVAAKTELELAGDAAERDAIRERVTQIRTRGELRAYLEHVRQRVAAERQAQGLGTRVSS